MSMVSKRKTTEELEAEIKELEAQEQSVGDGNDDSEQEVPQAKTTEDTKEKNTEEKPQANNEDKDEGTFKKRYGDLRRHSQARERELKEEIERLKAEKKEVEVRPLASDETVSEWKSKYPDIASIVETVADKIAQEKFERAKMDLEEIQKFKDESVQDRAKTKIREKHPDFDDITESDDFHDWTEDQPKWVQDAVFVNSDDPRSVIRVLDLYKIDKGIDTKSVQKTAKEAASSTKTKSTPEPTENNSKFKFSESQVERESRKDKRWYEKNEDAIMEAMRKGEFAYDLTGGAR